MIVYFPSCNFTKASPEASEKIKSYLKGHFGARIAGCCRPGHKTLTVGDTAVTICQSCSAICRENCSDVEELSVFELLDGDERFPWHDLSGEVLALQDCWRARNKPQLHAAVRSILVKMNAQVFELPENRERSKFCGTFRYNPMRPGNLAIAPGYFGRQMEGYLELHSAEEQQALMEVHCQSYPAGRMVCYCNSCLRGIQQGGGDGVHLMELMTSNM